MTGTKNGSKVKLHYTGKLDDGAIFDSSRERDPLEVTLGGGQLIPGFEEALMGMNTGESKSFKIKPEDAYGEYHDQLKIEIPRQHFPTDTEPAVGQQYQIAQEGGQTLMVSIVDVATDKITVDGNHPLAGKALNFDIEVLSVENE